MNREEYLIKTFPLEDGTTYIQNLDKHMSKNKVDTGKVAKKLHGLQKRINRSKENEGHSTEKQGKRKGFLRKLIDMLYGKGKPKK
jgi:septal ring factor EnvC (AmiA/AmiB activator)